MQTQAPLVRALGLGGATSLNLVTMVGSGIFVTLPIVLSAMGGPQAIVAWLLGMLLAMADGLVWAELGTAMPGAGGTYIYLLEAYGSSTWGRLWSFITLWGNAITMPLICAFTAVSFAQYVDFLRPGLTAGQGKFLAIGGCVLATLLAYRSIRSVGRISFIIFAGLLIAGIWVIAAGLTHFDWGLASDLPPHAFSFTPAFFIGVGSATIITQFDYQGYATVCLCGGEVKRSERTIPLSIIYAITGLGAFYVLVTAAVLGAIPWRQAAGSSHVVSDLMMRVQGPLAAAVVTVVIILATFASLFTTLVSFSRLLYAAAVDGQLLTVFARLHPTKRFPSVALVVLGFVSMLACLLPLETLLRAVAGVGVLSSSVPQVIALFVIRSRRRDLPRPFRMWLYPAPALVALAGWLFVLLSNDRWAILLGIVLTLCGAALYLLQARARRYWPFSQPQPAGAACPDLSRSF